MLSVSLGERKEVIINIAPPAFELSESFCILALERYTPVTLKWSRWVIILSARPWICCQKEVR